MTQELPEALQQQLAQFQQFQQQAQALAQQLSRLEMSARETGRTLEELEGLAEATPLYRATGAVMIKVADQAALHEELTDEQETLELRAKMVRKQAEVVNRQLKELHQQLEPQLAQQQGAGVA